MIKMNNFYMIGQDHINIEAKCLQVDHTNIRNIFDTYGKKLAMNCRVTVI